MARGLCQIIGREISKGNFNTNIRQQMTPRGTLQLPWSSINSVRTMAVLPWPFSFQPRDFSLPNSSWGSDMRRLYEHYNSQCEVETDDGEKKWGVWRRLPSYNRSLKYATGGVYLSKIIQSKARLFTRNIREQGAAFEHVHGGAIATMIDTVTGTHATYLSGPVMTANLNINYRSPIPLGSTVLLTCSLDKKEGRKTFVSCQVTNTDSSKLHTEATGLFLSITMGHLLGG
ncbi:acyl-coenzyme A thioesterase THEM4-like isoform X2 [Salmo trutta]|uniref:acyl-coenzyme A thioesterase THEM4-like isoform X2 n=1 Tax=Salmo trutta TaxID=8032 RepID=UPI0011300DC4|nr:acyl-coenzyme A thioesterase THEM4-like isoform X2 [Salmo trutta]